MFCFGACILALSLGPAKNPYSAQRATPQNGTCFIFMALNNVLKYQFLQCFLNINQNFPQSKWAPKKTMTFHNVQNQNWCFRNGLLGKIENIDVHQPKTYNLNNEKAKIRTYLKDETEINRNDL